MIQQKIVQYFQALKEKYNRQVIRYTLPIIGLITLSLFALFRYLPTRIAFVGFVDFQMAEIHAANNNPFIWIDTVQNKLDDFRSLDSYSVVFMFHIRGFSKQQQENLNIAKRKGTKVYVFAPVSGDNNISNLTKKEAEYISKYFQYGGPQNYRRLLNYTRRVFDQKRIFSDPVLPAIEYPNDVFYRIGDNYYQNPSSYWSFYRQKGLWKEGAQKVLIINNAASFYTRYRSYQDQLVLALEKKRYNVAVLSGYRKRLENIQKFSPDLIIYFPHGRLLFQTPDSTVRYLQQKNIPLLIPQLIENTKEKWMKDQKGSEGPLFAQNIVVPEIDGAITPYALAAKVRNPDGSYAYKELPRRIERFAEYVNRLLDLKRRPNYQKRIVVYYYKGPGKNALVAGGLEVASSLFTMLQSLKKSGYNTGNLPQTIDAFLTELHRRGPLPASFSKTSLRKFLMEGGPELISEEEYEKWVNEELDSALYAETKNLYGPFPGTYLNISKNGKDYLAIPRVIFGNIALVPVLPAALGESEFDAVHGVKKAPPHAYIASYLWARKKFRTHAIMHFGAHGSVEFTPWKQVLLSSLDWPEALIFPLPHYYVYSIDNIGEAMMAKRRTYATMLSHLTPPFAPSGLSFKHTHLEKLIQQALSTTDKKRFDRIIARVHRELRKSGLDKDLELDQSVKKPSILPRKILQKIHKYLHHLEQEKITMGLHTLGKSPDPAKIQSTVLMMTIDPLTRYLIEQSVTRGSNSQAKSENLHVTQKTRQLAQKMILKVLHGMKPTALTGDKRIQAILSAAIGYKKSLQTSASQELSAILNALNGGYVIPSAGGDPISNPSSIPTGKNLYSINSENMPTKRAWEDAQQLAHQILQAYKEKHGRYPEKVAYSLWGGEFVRNEGLNVAQILYMIGAEPVYNARGRVYDVRLIPARKMNRPRIDVIVQTSGQFRDIAASRVHLIQKAIAMAASSQPESNNYVAKATLASEKALKKAGLSAREARELSIVRVFGGINSSYGTGIMNLVEKSDIWKDETQIAQQYLNNMGAMYSDKHWGKFKPHVFETMLKGTEAVIHPRSSNNTGPISLDHVYEFMGGLSLAIRHVNGKDAEGYFNDYRNKNFPKIQNLKEAIWTESRTNLLNPHFIRQQLAEGPTALENIAESFRNTFGWNVMKPESVDAEIWQSYYKVYIKDIHRLGIRRHFSQKNPFAFQEITAVMLEAVRKGYWAPSEKVVQEIARAHTASIIRHSAGCSYFVCGNKFLQEFIAKSIKAMALKAQYEKALAQGRSSQKDAQAVELKKETLQSQSADHDFELQPKAAYGILLSLLGFSLFFVITLIRKRKSYSG